MMEASSSGKISSELMVHFLRNTGSIKNEREASPQRNNHQLLAGFARRKHHLSGISYTAHQSQEIATSDTFRDR